MGGADPVRGGGAGADPSAAARACAGRGHHTVLLGMAPGVGKTYRALEDLRRARDGGRDAVIGLLETHGRADTAAKAEGLETVPRREVRHGDLVRRELDLPALLERATRDAAGAPRVVAADGSGEGPATPASRPLLALIDELAHTNAPGLEHGKRWEDVEVALAAGIDVLSTVNVQHLESLNDQVADLTGVRVRETVPDRVLVDAEDVVLIDLPPAALVQRLRDGLVYPPDRIAPALNNFFRIERLTALRETALLQAAEEVGARRTGALRDGGPRASGASATGPLPVVGTRGVGGGRPGAHGAGGTGGGPSPVPRDRRMADDVADAVMERLLVLVSDRPGGQRVLRRAWRSARRLHAKLDALHVQEPGRAAKGAAAQRLEGLRRLASALGVELLVEESDEIDVVAARVARERGTTYLLLGAPRPRRGLARVREPLPLALVRRLPGVDVRMVARRDEGRRDPARDPTDVRPAGRREDTR